MIALQRPINLSPPVIPTLPNGRINVLTAARLPASRVLVLMPLLLLLALPTIILAVELNVYLL
jgi:hypothetical protein